MRLLQPTTCVEAVEDVWNEEVDGEVLRRLEVSSPATAIRRIGLTGINAVFRLHTVPKNDFCRLFVKAGLLDALSLSLKAVCVCVPCAFDCHVFPPTPS